MCEWAQKVCKQSWLQLRTVCDMRIHRIIGSKHLHKLGYYSTIKTREANPLVALAGGVEVSETGDFLTTMYKVLEWRSGVEVHVLNQDTDLSWSRSVLLIPHSSQSTKAVKQVSYLRIASRRVLKMYYFSSSETESKSTSDYETATQAQAYRWQHFNITTQVLKVKV